MQPTLKNSLIPQWDSLEGNWISSCRRLLFEVKDKGIYLLLLSDEGPLLVHTHVGPVYVALVSMRSYVYWSQIYRKPYFWFVLSLIFLTSSSSGLPKLWGDGLVGDTQFRAGCLKISHVLHSVWLCLYLFPSAIKGSFSGGSWARNLIYDYSRMLFHCYSF